MYRNKLGNFEASFMKLSDYIDHFSSEFKNSPMFGNNLGDYGFVAVTVKRMKKIAFFINEIGKIKSIKSLIFESRN